MSVRELIVYLQQMPPESKVGMIISLAKYHIVEDLVRSITHHTTHIIDEREYTNVVILSGQIMNRL